MEENKNQNNENNPNNNGKKSPNRSFLFMLIVSIGLTLLFFYAYSSYQTSQQEEISYSEFLTMLDEGKVESVKIYSSTVEVIPKEKAKSGKKKSYVAIRISDIDLVDRLEAAKEKGELDYTAVDESGSAMIGNVLSWVLMFGVFYLIIWLFMRSMSKSGGMMGVGKSNAKMYMERETGITFADVAGQEESKESLKEW